MITKDKKKVQAKKVSPSALEKKCLLELDKQGRLNDITRVMVTNIVSLQETAMKCKADIDENGIMLHTTGSTGVPLIKKNEAVTLQDKAVISMAKLLGQLGLDSIVEELDSDI